MTFLLMRTDWCQNCKKEKKAHWSCMNRKQFSQIACFADAFFSAANNENMLIFFQLSQKSVAASWPKARSNSGSLSNFKEFSADFLANRCSLKILILSRFKRVEKPTASIEIHGAAPSVANRRSYLSFSNLKFHHRISPWFPWFQSLQFIL